MDPAPVYADVGLCNFSDLAQKSEWNAFCTYSGTMALSKRSCVALLLVTGAVAACSSGADSSTSESDETAATKLRITEVLAAPSAIEAAFVEVRNDGTKPLDVINIQISVNGEALTGEPHSLVGEVPERVAPHALVLLADSEAPNDLLERVACSQPIATTRESLGPDHAASNDVLASTLIIQGVRECVPVISAKGLAGALKKAKSVEVSYNGKKLDEATADFAKASMGVSFERNGAKPEAFAISPIGSSPAKRNYYLDGPAEIEAHYASPWRRSENFSTPDPAWFPENPLTEALVEAIDKAKKSAVGSFFQINEPKVISALVRAKERGVDVRLTSDNDYAENKSYVEGYAVLKKAGIDLKFDITTALSHNKFLVIDDEKVWSGSFNPIEDEAARVHADNAVFFHSTELAQAQRAEFEIMYGGKFGVSKRDDGIAGLEAFVDGTSVELRFSPGLSDGQAKARAEALAATGDPVQACQAVTKGDKPVLEDRYRNVYPCGGPIDLLYSEVARATSSIYFMEFSLALDDLNAIMKERMAKGVEVKGVVDATAFAEGDVPRKIADEGGDVRITPNSDPACPDYITPKKNCPINPNRIWLHHKFMLVDYGTDHPVVITGSHNMSIAAEQKNDETLVVIRDRAVAETYYRAFRDAFDHPQTIGDKRPKADAPGLVITKVFGSADPAGGEYIELLNIDSKPLSLAGLSLWNRRTTVKLTDKTNIAPGGRAVLITGDEKGYKIPEGAVVEKLPEATDGRPFLGPSTPLVLMQDGFNWVSTFDPYTSEQNVPKGTTLEANVAYELEGVDSQSISDLTTQLLGVNTTPNDPVPTWSPKGFFSDWLDEHDVTPVGLALMKSAKLPWKIVEAPIKAK